MEEVRNQKSLLCVHHGGITIKPQLSTHSSRVEMDALSALKPSICTAFTPGMSYLCSRVNCVPKHVAA